MVPVVVTDMYNTLVGCSALLIASLATTASWAADETPKTQAFPAYRDHCHAANVCNGAYLAARGGKTIFVGAVGDAGDAARTPLTADSAFDIGSVAKEFTAATVLRLVDDHRLALDDAVASHLPGFPYRSEEHTSELRSLMRIPYAVFCLKKKNTQ